jgi:hypothetical protein
MKEPNFQTLKREDLLAERDIANEFVKQNLVDLCKELAEVRRSGDYDTLPKIKELRSICSKYAGSSSFSVALALISEAAVEKVANS